MQEMLHSRGYKAIGFMDDNFIWNEERTSQICEIMRRFIDPLYQQFCVRRVLGFELGDGFACGKAVGAVFNIEHNDFFHDFSIAHSGGFWMKDRRNQAEGSSLTFMMAWIALYRSGFSSSTGFGFW